MATNKLAIIRYQTLDKCFSNTGRRYYMENLIEECNKALQEFTGNEIEIKKRQLFEDIKFMESPQGWNIPLERIRDGHRIYFKYENKKFSINNQPLNDTETNQLKEALLTLSRFKGMPQFEWVAEITARIDSGFNLSNKNHNIIEFDQNNYLKGLDLITPIYNAIIYKQVLSVSYQSFKVNEKQTFTIHPYFLKQYNNRWFVFALNDASDRIINLALDRVVKLKELKKKYIENSKVDFNEYFEDIVGVSVNSSDKSKKVLISVKNELLPYIETKPLHGSQKIKERGKSDTVVSLDLIPNYEFEALVLSYGEGLHVLEPIDLSIKMAKRIEQLYKLYKKNN